MPEGVTPTLGPDATALGQIYWYTLEGRDKKGRPNGNWDPHELRTIQDFYVKYSLTSAKGVSEVASIGGFIKEYQVDIDPDKLRFHSVSIKAVIMALKESNKEVGAKTIEDFTPGFLIFLQASHSGLGQRLQTTAGVQLDAVDTSAASPQH